MPILEISDRYIYIARLFALKQPAWRVVYKSNSAIRPERVMWRFCYYDVDAAQGVQAI